MKPPTVRDRSDTLIQGPLTGHTSISGDPVPANAVVPRQKDGTEVCLASEVEGCSVQSAQGGGSVILGPQALKSQKPTSFNPNPKPEAKPGVTVHLGKGAPITGAAVFNSSSGKLGVL